MPARNAAHALCDGGRRRSARVRRQVRDRHVWGQTLDVALRAGVGRYLPVWAIYCFTVRVGYRRSGIAGALLDGLIDYAHEQGAPALEAYPVDTGGARIHGTAAYVGTIGMFERAGFRRVVETAARSDHRPRWLMRLELS